MTEEIVKVCKVHGGLDRSQVYLRKNKYFECRECVLACNKKTKSKNRKKYNDLVKEWKQKNPERARVISRRAAKKWRDNTTDIKERNKYKYAYREKNREKYLEAQRKYFKKQREELHDLYIKKIIVGSTPLRFSEISKDLVELQREIIKIKRFLKNEGNKNVNKYN